MIAPMTQPETPTLSPPRAAPLALWRALRAFLTIVFDLFGPPGEIAAMGALQRRDYTLVMAWLRAGEAFLRRLLFIEALALCGDLDAAPAKPGLHKQRTRRLVDLQPGQPEAWRVCFRVFASARTQRTGASGFPRAPIDLAPVFCPEPSRPLSGDTHSFAHHCRSEQPRRANECVSPAHRSRLRFPNAWPVAERFEAMLRACNDPQPLARRLGRALQRNGACAVRVLVPQADRLAQLFGAPYFTRCDTLARRRWRLLKPTAPETG